MSEEMHLGGVVQLPVTQKRLAELLKVDRTTVTKALAGNPAISEELRTRIGALAAELGYRPNYHSRSLRTRETRVISILKIGLGLSDLHSKWITSLHRWAYEAGYTVRLQSMADINTILAEQSADGFISFHALTDWPELEAPTGSAAWPIVFTDCGVADFASNSVAVDNAGGMAQLAKHLVERGHREVAFYGLVEGNGVCHDRYAGLLRQLNNMGISLPENRVISTGRWFSEPTEVLQHETALLELVKSGVTAIVSTSDVVAAGIVKLLRRHGVRVPHEVAVTGFDNSLAARVCEPTLTTVSQDVESASKAAVSMLLALIASGESQKCQVVPANLVIGESTTGGTDALMQLA